MAFRRTGGASIGGVGGISGGAGASHAVPEERVEHP